MEIERITEIIRKAKAVMLQIKDSEHKSISALAIQAMEDSFQLIKQQNIPCPPELEGSLEAIFAEIEGLYQLTATN